MKEKETNTKFNWLTLVCLIVAIACAVSTAVAWILYATKGENPYKVIHDLYADDTRLDSTVTVQGYYSSSLVQEDGTVKEAEEGETVYHFVTAFDEPKCCSITIEFISSTGEYPGMGDYVEVTGTYSRYSEGSANYNTVKDATWKHITAPK